MSICTYMHMIRNKSTDSAAGAACTDEGKVEQLRGSLRKNELRQLAKVLRAAGDGNRITILWALSQGRLCVSELVLLLNLSQSAVSHSLTKLSALDLVTWEREGRVVYYSLNHGRIVQLLKEGCEHVGINN